MWRPCPAEIRFILAERPKFRAIASASSISIAEIMIQSSLNKLNISFDPIKMVEKSRFEPLDCTAKDALLLKEMPFYHKDPFDRMPIARSIADKYRIMSDHSKFRLYDCKLIYQSNDGRRRCQLSDIKAVEEAKRTKEPYVYHCFAGFTEMAIPLVIGQILTQQPGKKSFERVRELATELGLDARELYEAYGDSLVIPEEKLHELVKFLSLFRNYITTLGHDLVLLRRKQESNVVGRIIKMKVSPCSP